MGVIIKSSNSSFTSFIKSGVIEDYSDGYFNLGINEQSSINNLSGGDNLTVFDGGGISYDANSASLSVVTSQLNFFRLTEVKNYRKFTFAARVDSQSNFEHIWRNSAAVTSASRAGGLLRDSAGSIQLSVISQSGADESLTTPPSTPSYPYSVVSTIMDNGSDVILSIYLKEASKPFIQKFQRSFSGTLAAGWDNSLIDVGRSNATGGVTDLDKIIVYDNAASDVEAEKLIELLG